MTAPQMIDYDYHREEARRLRVEAKRDFMSGAQLGRRISTFGTAFAVAGALFWATMLTTPPTSEAAKVEAVSIRALQMNAAPALPMAVSGHAN